MKKAATGPLRLPWRGWFIAGAPGGAGIGDWGLGIRLQAQRFRQSRIPYPESRLFHRIARPTSSFHEPSVTVARTEERRVGEECVKTCRLSGSAEHEKKKYKKQNKK